MKKAKAAKIRVHADVIFASVPDFPSMLKRKEEIKEMRRCGDSTATGRSRLDFDEIRAVRP